MTTVKAPKRDKYGDLVSDKQYWFKAKVYGYGWYPSTWQGALVTAIGVALIIIFSYAVDIERQTFSYISLVFAVVLVMIFIAYKKGEPARWRWGKN